MGMLDIEYGKEVLENSSEDKKDKKIMEMEMQLQNSSYGHEYVMMELQTVNCFLEEEALSNKLEEFKSEYFYARNYLEKHNPNRLHDLEIELFEQKTRVLRSYQA